MSVVLICAKTLAATSSASDGLKGGASGYDFGESQTGLTAPNQVVYLAHNGSQKITNLAVNVQPYSGTYGGDYSASSDLIKLTAHGDAAQGLQVDFSWNAVSPFSGTYSTFKSNTGVSFATRMLIPTTAFSRNQSGTEVAAVAPVNGQLGATADVNLGDRAHMTFRYQNPSSESQTGTRQFDIYFSFNFTS